MQEILTIEQLFRSSKSFLIAENSWRVLSLLPTREILKVFTVLSTMPIQFLETTPTKEKSPCKVSSMHMLLLLRALKKLSAYNKIRVDFTWKVCQDSNFITSFRPLLSSSFSCLLNNSVQWSQADSVVSFS